MTTFVLALLAIAAFVAIGGLLAYVLLALASWKPGE